MEFAITFKGDLSADRTVALCLQAELAGFDYAWFCDSHVLVPECYPMIAVCMRETKRLRFGPCVTNPGVRDWTLAASAVATLIRWGGERFDLGIGRGDSSVRLLGRKQFTVQTTVEFVTAQRTLLRGDKVNLRGHEVQLTWSSYEVPIWIAAYGPKALAAAGVHGDGLIIQLADPSLCPWFLEQARAAGATAGRDMSNYRVMALAPAWVGDIETGREQTRWFPAMVGNHVADIVSRLGKDAQGFPRRLIDYIEKRTGYDYRRHTEPDADHLDFVTNEAIESLAVLGPASAHVAKIKQLEAAGVTQFNIYLLCGEQERLLAEYGEHVIPHFK